MRVAIHTGQFMCERCLLTADGAPTFTREMTEDDSPTGVERCVACGRWSDDLPRRTLTDEITDAFRDAPFGFNA